MELPAGLIRWAQSEAKQRGVDVSALVALLLEREKNGGACVDVDVIEKPDGTFQVDVFPDHKEPGEKILGATREEALAKLEANMAANRRSWNQWRVNRMVFVPGFGRTRMERVELRPAMRRMLERDGWDWKAPRLKMQPERRR